jgi:multicomponent K+:H+ antiporter subunit E
LSLLAKIVPAPLISLLLLAMWLALARSIAPGQILLGGLLAIVVPLVTASLRPTKVRVRRPGLLVRYIVRVCGDVLTSSLQVAWGVVAWRWRRPQARFVVVPLDLRDPIGLAALAVVTTIVPGTVWSELAIDRSAILLHVWDVVEEGAFVAHYKARYEKPLQEIFE